jgi:hypothetical protein
MIEDLHRLRDAIDAAIDALRTLDGVLAAWAAIPSPKAQERARSRPGTTHTHARTDHRRLASL